MAATYEDAMTALRNADKAGDTAAAQKLAVIANKLKPQAEEAPTVSPEQRLHDFDPNAGFNAKPQVAAPSVDNRSMAKKYIIDPVIGVVEAPIALATGIPAGLKYASEYEKGRRVGDPLAAKKAEEAASKLQYMPRTPEGRYLAGGEFLPQGVKDVAGRVLPALGPAEAGMIGNVPLGQAANRVGAAVVNAPSNLARRAIRGADTNVPGMQARIQTMRDVNAPISVGEAAATPQAKFIESGAAKIPGGAGVINKLAERQQAAIAAKAEKVADSLATNVDPTIAGAAIEKGISGPEGSFMSRFRQSQKALYDKYDALLPSTAQDSVANTKAVLADLNSTLKDTPELAKLFQNSKIKQFEAALNTELGGTPPSPSPVLGPSGQPYMIPGVPPKTTIPRGTLKALRTEVGDKLNDPKLTSDVSTATWKRLYGALSEDMKATAEATGDPAVLKAFNRANNFTRAGHDRIETVLNKVVGTNKPSEEIYQAATNPTKMKQGATTINTVLKSLTPAERDIVKSTFIDRMGRPKPDADFSTETFIKNWENMDPKAKRAMFSGQDGKLRTDMDTIAKASAMANESITKTGWTPVQYAVAGSAALMEQALLGNFATASTLIGAMTGARATAKLMTNPKFVDWLAQSVKPATMAAGKTAPSQIPQLMANLSRDMQGEPDDVQAEVQQYMQTVMQSQQRPPQQQVPR